MEDYTILDGVKGTGHYVGTYMAWQQNSQGWWGEGEIKFYMDGDLPGGATRADSVGNGLRAAAMVAMLVSSASTSTTSDGVGRSWTFTGRTVPAPGPGRVGPDGWVRMAGSGWLGPGESGPG